MNVVRPVVVNTLVIVDVPSSPVTGTVDVNTDENVAVMTSELALAYRRTQSVSLPNRTFMKKIEGTEQLS